MQLAYSTKSTSNATYFHIYLSDCVADMSADEVAAVRSSFLRTIDHFGLQHGLQRAPDETPTTFRFRLEEFWMDAQGKIEGGMSEASQMVYKKETENAGEFVSD